MHRLTLMFLVGHEVLILEVINLPTNLSQESFHKWSRLSENLMAATTNPLVQTIHQYKKENLKIGERNKKKNECLNNIRI